MNPRQSSRLEQEARNSTIMTANQGLKKNGHSGLSHSSRESAVLTLPSKAKATGSSGQTSGTSTHPKSTGRILSFRQTPKTSRNSAHQQSPATTSSVRDSRARHSPSLAGAWDSMTHGERSFSKSCGSLGITGLHIYSLRTSRGCLITTAAGHSKPSCGRWTGLGTMRNGRCLTVKTSESPRIGRECSLSEILEEHVNQKYFLSEKMTKYLVTRMTSIPTE